MDAATRQDPPVILLVEDELALQSALRLLLQKAGFSVLTADGSAEALERAADPSRRIDVLLTDYSLHATTGRQLAEALGSTRPEMRVVYMSGYDRADLLAEADEDPDFPFLRKPFSGEHLVSLLRGLLRPERRRGATSGA